MGRAFNAAVMLGEEEWKQKFDFENDRPGGEGEALVW